MRKLLNTLYVTSPEAHLGRELENVLVYIEDKVQLRMPIHNLEGIVTFGYTGASPALMHLCASRGVALSFLNQNGRLLAKLASPVKGNVLLRKTQYSQADDPDVTLQLAKNFVFGKLMNSRTVLRRFLRDHPDRDGTSEVMKAVHRMKDQLERVLHIECIDRLRGIEGEAARTYYSVFNHLILDSKTAFFFNGRSRRPPLDRTNALLSFLYSLLAHECGAALETVGLDPQVGFLHRIRPGRSSLALDMMEELRPYLVERLVISLINTRQIIEKDLVVKESGGVLLTDDGRKKVIDAWQNRKQQEIVHPFFQEKIEVGIIPYAQAMLLARTIRGDIDGYPPFLIK